MKSETVNISVKAAARLAERLAVDPHLDMKWVVVLQPDPSDQCVCDQLQPRCHDL